MPDKPGYVRAPEFVIASKPTIDLNDITMRRWIRPRSCPVCRAGSFDTQAQIDAHVAESPDAEHAAWLVMEGRSGLPGADAGRQGL